MNSNTNSAAQNAPCNTTECLKAKAAVEQAHTTGTRHAAWQVLGSAVAFMLFAGAVTVAITVI